MPVSSLALTSTLLIFFLLLLLPAVASSSVERPFHDVERPSEGWFPSSYPNPSTEFSLCGRNGPSAVCDPDAILAPKVLDELDDVIDAIRADTKAICPDRTPNGTFIEVEKGYEIGVAIMERISPRITADDMAVELYDEWGLGSPGCGNGILVMLSVADRELHIAAGSQSKWKISSAELIESVAPTLREQLYANAMLSLVMDIGIRLAESSRRKRLGWLKFIVLGLLLSLMAYGIHGSIQEERQMQKSVMALQRMQRDAEQRKRWLRFGRFQDRRYEPNKSFSHVFQCPVCLKDIRIRLYPNGTQAFPRRNLCNAFCSPCISNKHTVLLRCGHRFCIRCVAEYLFRYDRCPICRGDSVGARTLLNPSSLGGGSRRQESRPSVTRKAHSHPCRTDRRMRWLPWNWGRSEVRNLPSLNSIPSGLELLVKALEDGVYNLGRENAVKWLVEYKEPSWAMDPIQRDFLFRIARLHDQYPRALNPERTVRLVQHVKRKCGANHFGRSSDPGLILVKDLEWKRNQFMRKLPSAQPDVGRSQRRRRKKRKRRKKRPESKSGECEASDEGSPIFSGGTFGNGAVAGAIW